MNGNWIKLFTKFTEWEWYKNKNTKDLFIHCLLKANWKDGKFEGIDIKRGSFATSQQTLMNELSMTKQELRTALKHLISTRELTQKKYSKFTVITVNNYEQYQQVNTTINIEATQEQHSSNTGTTTIEEYKTISSSNSIEEIRVRVYQFYESNFASLISPIEKEELNFWLDYFKNEYIINYAIRVAVLNKVTKMSYLNGIFQKWKENGFKTLEDCKPKEKEEKAKLELFDYEDRDDDEAH